MLQTFKTMLETTSCTLKTCDIETVGVFIFGYIKYEALFYKNLNMLRFLVQVEYRSVFNNILRTIQYREDSEVICNKYLNNREFLEWCITKCEYEHTCDDLLYYILATVKDVHVYMSRDMIDKLFMISKITYFISLTDYIIYIIEKYNEMNLLKYADLYLKTFDNPNYSYDFLYIIIKKYIV